MIRNLGELKPKIGTGVFVAESACVVGDVELGDNVSIFFGAVLRGDLEPIRIGRGSNIQEHSVVHTSHGKGAAVVGEYVTVGHHATIHGATVSDRCLIGMGSILLDDAFIEEECVIGAGTLIPERKRIPARSLVVGSPGKVVRSLTDEEVKFLTCSAEGYIKTGALYLQEGFGSLFDSSAK